MLKILRWTGLTILGLVVLVFVGVGGFLALGIPVELSGFRAPVEKAASLALDRKVTIDGSVSLAPSLEPTLQIEGVHVANAEGWSEPDLMYLSMARLQLAVLPLLERRIDVVEVAIDGFRANLEKAPDGSVNWLLAGQAAARETASEAPADAPASDTPTLSAFEIADLSLDDIVIAYRDAGTGADYTLTLDSIDGSAVRNQPMDLSIEGTVQQVPYTVSISAGSLAALMRGDESWPATLSMGLLGATLNVEATVAEPLRASGLQATFSLSGDDLQDLEALVGEELPPISGYVFKGRITEEDRAYALTDFEARVGETTLSGVFSVDPSGAVPEFQGQLDIASVDLGPVFAAIESGRSAGADGTESQPQDADALDPNEPFLTLDFLQAFQGAFDMTVGEVVGAPTTVRAVALKVAVSDGVLRAPMRAQIADVGFTGSLLLDGASTVPEVSVALQATETDIGNLAEALFDVEGIDGGFGRAGIELAIAGESVAELAQSLDFDFTLEDAALSYGNRPGENPVGFTLDAAELLLPRGEVLQATAEGTVLEEAFTLAFVGADIGRILGREPLPLELTASGGGASLSVEGSVAEMDDGGAAVTFALRGDRIGGLSRWLGVSADAAADFDMQGAVSLDQAGLSLDPLSVQIGGSVLSGAFARAQTSDGPLITVAVSSELLALDELSGLFPKDDTAEQGAADDEAFSVNVPILPMGVDLQDADLDLALAEIVLEDLVLRDVSLSSSIRDGRVAESPFGASIAGARLDGSVSLDLTTSVPAATFAVATDQIDIGDFLNQLGVIDGLEAKAGRLSLDLAVQGATARQMFERSQFEARITEAQWVLRDPNLDGAVTIGLDTGTVTAAPEQPVAMRLEGEIEREPITIELRTAPLAEFADEKDSLPLDLDIALAGAKLSLDAVAGLPVKTQGLEFRLDLQGENLDRFDGLLDASLPPLGPYALGGDFTIEPEGYRIEDFSVAVGASQMEGRFNFATAGERPRLDVDLTTKTLQLDDFRFGDWSPLDEVEEEEPDSEEAKELEQAQTKEEIRALLSPAVMRSLDAELDLKVDEVLSGADELGSGSLLMTLQDGRFEVEPMIVNIPGGSVQVELAYEPDEDSVSAEARARIEQLDYGVLARRIDPESDVGGIISVDIDLSSEAEDLDRVMAHANGNLDFAVWPKDLEASLFDLWAVNLVTSVLPSVDSEETSKFNCMIARFKVEDGIMTPEAILVDSTRIQASGDGAVDFKEETVNFTMSPKAKRPQMFSANTPVAVNGKFDDFGVGVAPGGIPATVIRFTTSPITTPFLWVFSTPVAEDGVEACAEAWAREPDEMLEEVKGSAGGK